jgi:energy-coupling factor transporter transmembrane protein EcfT
VPWSLVKAFKKTRLETLKEYENVWKLLFVIFLIIVFSVYTFTTVTNGIDTYRYLVIVPFIVLFLLLGQASKLPQKYRSSLSVLLLVSIVLNFYITLSYNRVALKAGGNPNQVNLEIIDGLKSRGLTKGYANYWDGNINTYLSSGAVDFLPVSCTKKGTLSEFRWLLDGNLYTEAAEKTFIMIDPVRIDTTLCSEANLLKQFGTPEQSFITKGRSVYIYNYDVVVNFN